MTDQWWENDPVAPVPSEQQGGDWWAKDPVASPSPPKAQGFVPQALERFEEGGKGLAAQIGAAGLVHDVSPDHTAPLVASYFADRQRPKDAERTSYEQEGAANSKEFGEDWSHGDYLGAAGAGAKQVGHYLAHPQQAALGAAEGLPGMVPLMGGMIGGAKAGALAGVPLAAATAEIPFFPAVVEGGAALVGGFAGGAAAQALFSYGSWVLQKMEAEGQKRGLDLSDPANVSALMADKGFKAQTKAEAARYGITDALDQSAVASVGGKLLGAGIKYAAPEVSAVTGNAVRPSLPAGAAMVAGTGAADVLGQAAGFGAAGEAARSQATQTPFNPEQAAEGAAGMIGPGLLFAAHGAHGVWKGIKERNAAALDAYNNRTPPGPTGVYDPATGGFGAQSPDGQWMSPQRFETPAEASAHGNDLAQTQQTEMAGRAPNGAVMPFTVLSRDQAAQRMDQRVKAAQEQGQQAQQAVGEIDAKLQGLDPSDPYFEAQHDALSEQRKTAARQIAVASQQEMKAKQILPPEGHVLVEPNPDWKTEPAGPEDIHARIAAIDHFASTGIDPRPETAQWLQTERQRLSGMLDQHVAAQQAAAAPPVAIPMASQTVPPVAPKATPDGHVVVAEDNGQGKPVAGPFQDAAAAEAAANQINSQRDGKPVGGAHEPPAAQPAPPAQEAPPAPPAPAAAPPAHVQTEAPAPLAESPSSVGAESATPPASVAPLAEPAAAAPSSAHQVAEPDAQAEVAHNEQVSAGADQVPPPVKPTPEQQAEMERITDSEAAKKEVRDAIGKGEKPELKAWLKQGDTKNPIAPQFAIRRAIESLGPDAKVTLATAAQALDKAGLKQSNAATKAQLAEMVKDGRIVADGRTWRTPKGEAPATQEPTKTAASAPPSDLPAIPLGEIGNGTPKSVLAMAKTAVDIGNVSGTEHLLLDKGAVTAFDRAVRAKTPRQAPPDVGQKLFDASKADQAHAIRWLTGFDDNGVAVVLGRAADGHLVAVDGRIYDFLTRNNLELRSSGDQHSTPMAVFKKGADVGVASRRLVPKGGDILATHVEGSLGGSAPTEHPGLVIKSLQTGKETLEQPPGTVKPGTVRDESPIFPGFVDVGHGVTRAIDKPGAGQTRLTIRGDETSGYTVVRSETFPNGITGSSKVEGSKLTRDQAQAIADKYFGKQSVNPLTKANNRVVGKNAEGKEVWEDANGVRSTLESGIRSTENVQMTPRGPMVDKGRRGAEFKTEDEIKAENAAKPIEDQVQDFIDGKRPDAPQVPTTQTEPTKAPEPPAYGSANTLFTADAAAKARAVLKAKMGQLNAGLDPETITAGMTLAGYHIEAGARSFADYAGKMVADFGEAIRPFLRTFYEAARHYPGFDAARDMTPAGHISDDMIANAGRQADNGTKEAQDGLQTELPPGNVRQGAETDAGVANLASAESASQTGDRAGLRAAEGRPDQDGRGPGSSPSPAGGGSAGDRAGRDASVPGGRRLPVAEEAGAEHVAAIVKQENPSALGTNHVITPGSLGTERPWRQKATDNIAIIRLVKQLESAGRPATRGEQDLLARYVGWGGLKDVFPDVNSRDQSFKPGWEKMGGDLRSLLTDTEYATAMRSTQYAHYTAEPVVRAMWDAMQRLGYDGGALFEPGMGIGNFRGMMPPDLAAKTAYSGIEMDHMTARIAALLYPKDGVRRDDFTKVPLPADTFDAAIGNPPFSDTPIKSDPKYAAAGFLLHDYFFAKTLDGLRPGGVMGFVTSAGTLNKLDPAARNYLADRADFLGAVRLPGNAFEQNAGTSVTTDIIFLRKRLPGESEGDRSWTQVAPVTMPNREGVPTEGNVNSWILQHPEMVLGTPAFNDKLYPNRYAVTAPPGFDISSALSDAVNRLPQGVVTRNPAQAHADVDISAPETKDGSFYLGKNGQLMQYSDGAGQPVKLRGKDGGTVTKADAEKIKAMVPVRDAVRSVFAAMLDEGAGNLDAAQARLHQAYDAFVGKYGPINRVEYQTRRPSPAAQEDARNEARETARAADEHFNEGDADLTRHLNALKADGKRTTNTDIAKMRQAARDAATAKGRSFDEGDFDPETMPDVLTAKYPNMDMFADDPENYRIRTIEDYNEATDVATKGRIFSENILGKTPEPEIHGAADALGVVLSRVGRVDIDAIAEAAGIPRADALRDLGDAVYRLPGTADTWVTRDEYLSGNVRRKLADAVAAAQADPDLARNAEALRQVQPEDLPPSRIGASLGATWIPESDISAFAREALGLGDVHVTSTPEIGQWSTDGDRKSAAATSTWGTADRDGVALLEDALNQSPPTIRMPERDDTGRITYVVDKVATEAAQLKFAAIKDAFKDWVWKDGDRAGRLARTFNDIHNNLVDREFNGDHLTTPGMASNWSLRPHQKRVVWRIVQSGNTYMAHAVGAGKTSAMISAGMEMRRLGQVNKPMYVVPNHMLAQFAKEFLEQYPLAKIMVADERQFHTSRRKQFVANAAAGDLDAVIMTHSSFGKIKVSDEFSNRIVQEQLDQYRQVLTNVDPDDRTTRRRVENAIEKMEQRLEGRKTAGQDQGMTFEETGADFLFVDEAHNFRKLDFATAMGNLKGIDPSGSKMAHDLYVKGRYLDTVRPDRNMVLASGTPITNTLAELYTIGRYLQRDQMRERQIEQFDNWAATYGDTVTKLEKQPSGLYKPVTRFARFQNASSLAAMFRDVADVVTSHDLTQYVTRPAIEGGQMDLVVSPRSDAFKAYQADLGARMESIANRKGAPKKGDDIMLNVINDGRHAAMDMRNIDPSLPNDPGSKLNQMIDRVHDIWRSTGATQFSDPRTNYEQPAFRGPATQMVFSDLGIKRQERNGASFSAYDTIKAELIRRGVPADQIAFMRDYKDHSSKQRLFNDMNEGKVRVLIGSTGNMGTGVNAQRRLYSIHNLDAPWYPADLVQRLGRGHRQGNYNPTIRQYGYATEGSYDEQMWSLLEKKQRFIDQIMSGKVSDDEMDDVGAADQYAAASAIASGDQRVLKQAALQEDVARLQRQASAHLDDQVNVRQQISNAGADIRYAQDRLDHLAKDQAQRVETKGDAFKMTVGNSEFDDRQEAGKALLQTIDAAQAEKQTGKRVIGSVGGFDVVFQGWNVGQGDKARFQWGTYLDRSGFEQDVDTRESTPRGVVQSIESKLRQFEDEVVHRQDQIDVAKRRIADYQSRLGKPFPKADQLEKARADLEEVNADLRGDTAAQPATEPLPRQDDAMAIEGEQHVPAKAEDPMAAIADPLPGARGQIRADEHGLGDSLNGAAVSGGDASPWRNEASDAHTAARDEVLMRGAADGNEHNAFVDHEGKTTIETSGEKDRALFSPEMEARLNDPTERIITHHNHPDGGGITGTDLSTQGFRGTRGIVAYGPDGKSSAAWLTVPARELLSRLPEGTQRGYLNKLYQTAWAAAKGVLEHHADAMGDPRHALREITARALDGVGLIHYESDHSADLPAGVHATALYGAVNAVHAELRNIERRNPDVRTVQPTGMEEREPVAGVHHQDEGARPGRSRRTSRDLGSRTGGGVAESAFPNIGEAKERARSFQDGTDGLEGRLAEAAGLGQVSSGRERSGRDPDVRTQHQTAGEKGQERENPRGVDRRGLGDGDDRAAEPTGARAPGEGSDPSGTANRDRRERTPEEIAARKDFAAKLDQFGKLVSKKMESKDRAVVGKALGEQAQLDRLNATSDKKGLSRLDPSQRAWADAWKAMQTEAATHQLTMPDVMRADRAAKPSEPPKPPPNIPAESRPDAKGPLKYPVQAVQTALKMSKDSMPGRLARRLLGPGSYDESAKWAASAIKSAMGHAALHNLQVREALKGARDAMDRASPEDKERFANAVDTGNYSGLTPEFRRLAEGLKLETQQITARLQTLGVLDNAKEDYLGRMWKPRGEQVDKDTEGKVLAKLSQKAPLTGSKSFLKQRYYDTWAEARAAGLEPVFDNPVDAHLFKLGEMNKFYAGTTLARDVKASGIVGFYKVGGAPEGMMELQGPEFHRKTRDVTNPDGTTHTVPEGAWYGPEGLARVFNNYQSTGLNQTIFREPYQAMRSVGNAMNMLQLGLSAFHPVATTIEAQVTRLGIAIDNAVAGNYGKAVKEALGAISPTNWVTHPMEGDRLLKALLNPADAIPEMKRIVDAFGTAGGRVWMERIFRPTDEGAIKFWKSGAFGSALRQAALHYPDSRTRQALNIAGRCLESVSAPIMDELVPRQKLGAFSMLAKDWMERNPEASSDDTKFVRAMQDIGETVDNRFGEMVYDNLFWSRTLKDISHLVVRSVGWNMGTLREIGGGAAEAAHFALAKAGGQEAEWSRRMSYLIALPVMTGLYGAMYQYLATGQGPQGDDVEDRIKDLLFPRTGLVRNDGAPERISIPSYVKDVYAWSQRPTQTAKNKLHPLISTMAQAWDGRDFYGNIIANRDDPAVQQVEDALGWALSTIEPFSIQASARMFKERSGVQAAMGMLGFNPAPGYIANPEAGEKWDERQHRIDVKKKMRDESKRARPSAYDPNADEDDDE